MERSLSMMKGKKEAEEKGSNRKKTESKKQKTTGQNDNPEGTSDQRN